MSNADLASTWDDHDSFFDVTDAARMTLTPVSTLRRWIGAGVVSPSRVAAGEDGQRTEGFSLRDLAYIRIIRQLTAPVAGSAISLEQAVRHVSHALARLAPLGSHWADAHLIGEPGPLVFIDDEHRVTQSLPGGTGQRVFEDMLDVHVRCMLLGPESLLIPPDLLAYIEMNPRKRSGHPVVRGTNIPTAMVFSIIETDGGLDRAESLYPFVPKAAFMAVRDFHTEYLHERRKVLTR